MRLVKAEILKLRKRRGLMVWSALLTVGAVVIAYTVMLALHAANPAHHGPAGGARNLENVLWLLATLGGIAAVTVGTTAGSQDRSSGVFRDLVVSGRSRRMLFHVRTPGALASVLPLVAVAFALTVAGSYAFAGGGVTESAHQVVLYGASTAALVIVNTVLGVALGSMVPARVATGALIGWNAVLASIIASIPALGAARRGIDVAAAAHWAPSLAGKTDVAMAGTTALAVLIGWIVVSLKAGSYWTERVDA
jgi:hypothetical protein